MELYTQWAGPTAAVKGAWRSLALEHGGALPCELSAAAAERLGAAPALAPYARPTTEPAFCLFRGGREVAHVRGVNIPALLQAIEAHSKDISGAAEQAVAATEQAQEEADAAEKEAGPASAEKEAATEQGSGAPGQEGAQ